MYTLQDLKGISTFLDDLEEEEYLNKELMNDSRNLKMVEKLTGIMNKQSVLVCVGAVHLCGEDGIIEPGRKGITWSHFLRNKLKKSIDCFMPLYEAPRVKNDYLINSLSV